jgi:hypothetical protein
VQRRAQAMLPFLLVLRTRVRSGGR